MKLRIVAVGTKSPAWVQTGYSEYAKRLPPELKMQLVEVSAPKHQGDPAKFRHTEGEKMLTNIQPADWVVALEEGGKNLSSVELAKHLDAWRMQGQDVIFVVGGSDGLSDAVLQRANMRMSLSALTFPHYMVRVILAETLYRAWSISAGHPYHRA